MKSMYTFLYIEDDELYRQYFIDFVNEYFHKKEIIVEWQVYNDIPEYIDDSNVDACFLDIEVGEKNTLDIVRENHIRVPIIFITQYSSYVYESVHFHIFDYVRKFKLEEEIYHTLERLEKYYEYYDEEFMIKYNGNIYKIKIGEIDFLKTLSHRTIIYKSDREVIDIWKSYNQIFEKEYSSLSRVHKSYVVNINNCQEMKKNNMYFASSDVPIPVSTRRYKEVKELFLKSKMNRV